MELSIIIQAYNRSSILTKTLIGLSHQKLMDGQKFEVIVIDNDSEENLDKAISVVSSKLDINYMKRSQLKSSFSIASGRNIGIQLAKYDHILIMDSDIYLPKDLISKLLFQVCNKKSYLITAKRIFIDSKEFSIADLIQNEDMYLNFPSILSESNYYLPEDNRFSHGNILTNLKNGEQPWAYFYGMFTCFRKSDSVFIGGYDESFDGHWGYEDIDFSYRFINSLKPSLMVLEDSIVYHQEPDHFQEPVSVKEDRLKKSKNPNWIRICEMIPSFSNWKSEYYKKIAGELVDV